MSKKKKKNYLGHIINKIKTKPRRNQLELPKKKTFSFHLFLSFPFQHYGIHEEKILIILDPTNSKLTIFLQFLFHSFIIFLTDTIFFHTRCFIYWILLNGRRFAIKISKTLKKIYILFSQFNYIFYCTFSTTYIVN